MKNKSRKRRNSRARRPVKILDPGRAAQTVIGRSWTENYKAVTISLKKYFVPFHTSSFFEDMSNQPIKKLFLQFWQSFISRIFFEKYTFFRDKFYGLKIYNNLTLVSGLNLTFDLGWYDVFCPHSDQKYLTLSCALRKCHWSEIEFSNDQFCFDNRAEVDFQKEWDQSHPQSIQSSHKMPIVLYVVQYTLFQLQHGALSRFYIEIKSHKLTVVPFFSLNFNQKCYGDPSPSKSG